MFLDLELFINQCDILFLKEKMAKIKKQRFEGVVYSTDQNYQYIEEGNEEEVTLSPSEQNLRIMLDKKQRAGKAVTLVSGFRGSKAELNELGKRLRQACGTGGSVKDGEIIVQGDFRRRIADMLKGEGFKIKVIGI